MFDGAGSEHRARCSLLTDPELRARLECYVRRRTNAGDVADVVQSSLVEALAADNTPSEPQALRRFVFVIARNKIIDQQRRRAAEVAAAAQVSWTSQTPEDSLAARDLLDWAREQAPGAGAENTFEWMIREAQGHKLEHIAEEARLPAPRVRKRVSRLRRLLRARWALYLAGGGMLLLTLGSYWIHTRSHAPRAEPETVRQPTRRGRAEALRRGALERCRAGDHAGCLDALERARVLDPAGDAAAEVERARSDAQRALTPAPPPKPLESVLPIPTSAPKPRPLRPPATPEAPTPSLSGDVK